MSATEPQGTLLGYPLYPKFVEGQPRFPTDTFMSRYLNYLDVIDPRTLIASNVFDNQKHSNRFCFLESVHNARQLLDDYRKGQSKATDQQLWEAQKLKTAIFHPDTDEKILPPFRMSGFVPFGWITVTGMLLPNPSWPTILFWQWANQTHNACVNYANRNASKPQPFSIYAQAYGCAVSAAMGVSATLTWFIKRATNLSHTQKLIIQRFVPLPATSLASTLNVLCMRAPELKTGITVYDSQNNAVGASKVAAKKAVFETAVTRAFLPVPLLLAPPCIMPFLERLKFVQKSAGRHLLVNAFVCTISFGLSLPVALALFPQQAKIHRKDLEPELQDKTNDEFVYFNKGL